MDARRFLDEVSASVTGRFGADRSILAFDEYLEGCLGAPRRAARSAAQYLLAAIDHWGTRTLDTPVGETTRYRLFDAEFAGGQGRIAGQEDVAAALSRILRTFARQGRVDRLILLHGPNGSAKSSIVSALMAALEAYSHTDEGAVYRFAWVFPKEQVLKGAIGFGGGSAGSSPTVSFAHLEGEALEARIGCEMKDHPLLLLPAEERQRVLRRALERSPEGGGEFIVSDYLARGGLCQKCQTIHQALMASYGGDWARVLSHVQVERFHYSRRYLSGAVTVEPQVSVDAAVRAQSLDRSAGGLPPALQTVNLLEPFGPLVNGNRGIIEYADILKRPLEAFKYLLGTSETAEVRMEHLVLQMDTVLIASSNEVHLSAFKSIPDFGSFKGRIELVRVPYLRRTVAERQIYESQVTPELVGKHVAPHAIDVAVRWAVLGRLKKPDPDAYPESVRSVVQALRPEQKLALYDSGDPGDGLPMAQVRDLRSVLDGLYRESESYPAYEGSTGASPREVKAVLFNAAHDPERPCLDVPAVLEELAALVKERSVYAFLQEDAVDGFHDHARFVDSVREHWLDAVEREVRDAWGFVEEAQYRQWFERYVAHVSALVKGEKIRNQITGASEPPDDKMMGEMEAIIMGADEDADEFRQGLMARIASHRIEHPAGDAGLDYPRLFPDFFRRLKDHYHDERRKELRRAHEQYLRYRDPAERGRLTAKEREQVEKMLGRLREEHGYCDHCAQGAILALMRARHQD